MLSQTAKKSFRYLLETTKTMPAYQRGFVWEPDIVQSFVGNICEASEDNNIDSYFCGSMVLFQNQDNVYEIVDGQQRTTVVHILVSYLTPLLSHIYVMSLKATQLVTLLLIFSPQHLPRNWERQLTRLKV